jgi:hypothetical protein
VISVLPPARKVVCVCVCGESPSIMFGLSERRLSKEDRVDPSYSLPPPCPFNSISSRALAV